MPRVATILLIAFLAPFFAYAEDGDALPHRNSRVEYLTEKPDKDTKPATEIAPPGDVRKRPLKQIIDYLSYNSGMNITLKTEALNRMVVEVDLSSDPKHPKTWRDQLEAVCQKYKLRIDDSHFKERVVIVYKPETITFDYKDADIRQVVMTIAEVGKLNVVIDPEVQGKVTASLKDVPCEDALDVVVKSLGYVIVSEKGALRMMKQ